MGRPPAPLLGRTFEDAVPTRFSGVSAARAEERVLSMLGVAVEYVGGCAAESSDADSIAGDAGTHHDETIAYAIPTSAMFTIKQQIVFPQISGGIVHRTLVINSLTTLTC